MHPRAGKDERDIMPRCRICLKPLERQYTFVQWLLQEEELCNECLMRLRPEPRHLHLDDLPLTAYYRYDEFMESLLFQFKEGRDVALAPVFFSQVMKQMKGKADPGSVNRMAVGADAQQRRAPHDTRIQSAAAHAGGQRDDAV